MPEQTVELSHPGPNQGRYAYDLFISYSHKNQDYVRGELYTQLSREGLKLLLDDEDFLIGDNFILRMEQAVAQSRHLLVVLTPAWLESSWGAFENLLVTGEDPLGKQRRVLPLLLEPCTPPPRLKNLIYANFTDPAGRDEEMARLVRSIRADAPHDGPWPPATRPETESTPARSVRKGIAALADLVRNDRLVRDEVVKFQNVFQIVQEQICVLGDYKAVHDLLHEMQIHSYNVIVREAKRFPDEEARQTVADYEFRFHQIINRLEEITCRASFKREQLLWTQDLRQARQDLAEAVDGANPAKLKTALVLMKRTLARQPAKIDARLSERAADLRLDELVQALASLCAKLAVLAVDPDKIQELQTGAGELRTLHENLQALVSDHNLWQEIDDQFRVIEETLDEDINDLIASWPGMRATIEPLYRPCERDAEFKGDADRLDESIRCRDLFKIRQFFRRFRGHANNRFYEADKNLRSLCEELRAVGQPLALMLKVMQ